MPCKATMTASLNAAGTKGLKTPVEMSPSTMTSPTKRAMTQIEGEARMDTMSGQER
jgi:hypothetical protein